MDGPQAGRRGPDGMTGPAALAAIYGDVEFKDVSVGIDAVHPAAEDEPTVLPSASASGPLPSGPARGGIVERRVGPGPGLHVQKATVVRRPATQAFSLAGEE